MKIRTIRETTRTGEEDRNRLNHAQRQQPWRVGRRSRASAVQEEGKGTGAQPRGECVQQRDCQTTRTISKTSWSIPWAACKTFLAKGLACLRRAPLVWAASLAAAAVQQARAARVAQGRRATKNHRPKKCGANVKKRTWTCLAPSPCPTLNNN